MKLIQILISTLLVSCGVDKAAFESENNSPTSNQNNRTETTSTETEVVKVPVNDNKTESVVVTAQKTFDETGVEVSVKFQLGSFLITSPSTDRAGVVKTKTPTIQWSKSNLDKMSLAESDVEYVVKVGTESTCSNPTQQYTTTSTTTTLDSLNEGTHYICLDAKGDGKQKAAANSPYLLIVELDKPVVLVPQPFSITGPGSLVARTTKITLTWSASVNATLYEVKKSSTASCDGLTVATTTSTSLNLAVTNLETAYFCVYAKNGDNTLGSGNPYKVEVNVESGLVSAQSLGLWNGTWTQQFFSTIVNWNDLKNQGLKWTTSTGKTMYTFSDVHIEEGTDRVRFYLKTTSRNTEWIELMKNY
jgi:hypothetical protein